MSVAQIREETKVGYEIPARAAHRAEPQYSEPEYAQDYAEPEYAEEYEQEPEPEYVAPEPPRTFQRVAAPRPTPVPVMARPSPPPPPPTQMAQPVSRLPPPPPLPQITTSASDTMAPIALGSTAALAVDRLESRPSFPMMGKAPSRTQGFFIAASIGMVGAIFALGIAVGFVSFGATRMAPNASAATMAPAARELMAAAPKPAAPEAKTDVAEVHAPETKLPDAPKVEPAKAAPEAAKIADAPKPADAPKVADVKAPEVKLPEAAKAAIRAESRTASHDDAKPAKHAHAKAERAVVAERKAPPAPVAAAPKADAPKRVVKAAAPSDDMDMANEADALAKAQLDASLR